MKIIKDLRKAGCNLFLVGLRFVYIYLFYGKKIIAHQKTVITGIRNIEMNRDSVLLIGTDYRGFLTRYDRTLLNIRGTLVITGTVHINQGARIDVGVGGILELKNGVNINAFTKVICANKISIGENTGISWDCQIMDDDFHRLAFWGEKQNDNTITLGKNVWVGCRTAIYKGVTIADGCMIASDTIIKRKFNNPDSIIFMKTLNGELKGELKRE